MTKREIIFGACAAITPDFAAKLAQAATQTRTEVYLECGSARLCMDSLISILSMGLRKGTRVTVSADGADEAEAVDRVCALLAGEN